MTPSTSWILLSLLSLGSHSASVHSFTTAAAFVAPHQHQQQRATTKSILFAAAADVELSRTEQISEYETTLERAAETKQEDSDTVGEALTGLEKMMRKAVKEDDTVATNMLQQLNGDWRLVFTTGTAKTQERFGKISYFPIKAVQSFSTLQEPMKVQNGIYVGDFAVLKFSGPMDFDLKKCRLNFDFDTIAIFNGAVNIPLKKGEAAGLGAKSGLGSESNVKNAEKGKQAFFNWIQANDKIATARGGGGGLALWKRVVQE
jgi:predicted house-cleaning NTP pyrophosphatase (Maf/HAM1 superfamily)